MSSSDRPLFEVSKVETPEQVDIDLPLAGIGTRGLAYLLDLVFQLIPLMVLATALYVILPEDARPSGVFDSDHRPGPRRLNPLAGAIFSMIVFVTNFGYFVIFELRWRGQSPGKRTLGLRVMRDGGYAIDGRCALVRNLLRAVDILPFAYLLGMVTLFIGRQGKRVGDYAAGTIVVSERRDRARRWPEAPAPRAAERLSLEERALVEQFLLRRASLGVQARARLARELATRLSRRLGQPPPADAEQFLERV
jgi:uncharacterized RDD family membrane protein YckC